jgi:hypothetical protein
MTPKHKQCIHCDKRASFNIEGLIPRFCKEHSTKEMINVNSKKCKHCKKRASFNIDSLPPEYCSDHATDEMVDVRHKRCLHCKKRALYNIKGQSPKYCSDHASSEMVEVSSKKCEECDKSANFNLDGESPRFCKDHASVNMVDVTTKKCEQCKKQALFNIEGQPARFCKDHSSNEMIDVKHKTCQHCTKQANFNIEGQKAMFCKDHSTTEMINVNAKRCKTTLCGTQIHHDRYNGYCLRCCVYMCPDIQVSRNYKTKETSIVDSIKEKYPTLSWICDKRIQNGSSLRRPDILLDMESYLLIIEIDENQHNGYDCSCENKRLMEISKDVGHRSIVFIRFNPDDYIDEYNKTITSCWNLNKAGLMVLNQSKRKEWNERINSLYNQVDYWLTNKPDKTIEIVQLFFDKN